MRSHKISASHTNHARRVVSNALKLSETPGGEYIQENMGFQAFWGQLFQAIPALSGVASALNVGGIAPINSSTQQTVQNYLNGHNGQVGSCFSGPLNVG